MSPRSARWFADDFVRDLTHGARLLRRNPAFTTVVVATLAVAIGATATVFSVVDAWLFRPLAFPEPHRLVIAFAARPERPTEPAVWLPYRIYLGWSERTKTLSSVSAAFVRDVIVTSASDAQTILGLNVTPEFFHTVGVAPLLGRTLSEADATGPHAVVLSHGLWQRRFGGSRTTIGSMIVMSGVPHEIVGVMPADFDTRVLDMRFEFWTMFRPGEPGYDAGGVGPVTVIGRLKPGITIDTARPELTSIARDVESKYPANFNKFVISLSSLQEDNTRTVRTTLLTVSAAVVALLLIAAMNVGTLLLGRGLGRMREAAIRAAIGCGRGRLVRQFLTESLLMASAGGIAGLAFAAVAVRLFVAWNPLGALPANAIRMDLRVLAATGAALALTTIVCGLAPALRVSTADPNDALHTTGERSTARGRQRAQAAMIVAQMAACVVLLVATTLLIRTFVRLQTEPLGFDPKGLWVAGVILPNEPFDSSAKRNVYYRQLADRVRALPGVRAVAAGTARPLNSGAPVTVRTGGEDSSNAPRISAQDVTSGFFEAVDTRVLAGRSFDDRDSASGAPVLIVNARAAQELFGGTAAAIGQRVRINQEPWREIVGVVGNVRSTFFNTLAWQTNPIVYRPAAQAFSTFSNPTATTFGFHLHVRSDHPLAMEEVRTAALEVSSHAAVTELRSASEMIAEATKQPAFRMTLLSWFAGVSLLLAAIGVYGLVSQAVSHRVREIAIRLALGARPSEVIGAMTLRAVALGVAGVVIGIPAAFVLGGVLEALLWGVPPRDAMSFAAAAAALLAMTAIAALVPALRVARVDPAAALRAD